MVTQHALEIRPQKMGFSIAQSRKYLPLYLSTSGSVASTFANAITSACVSTKSASKAAGQNPQ
jgi:hypothetical protein